MGACASSTSNNLIDAPDGDQKSFHERFRADQVLGQGEFGVVHRVHASSKTEAAIVLACKTLRKGIVFQDNQLYPPLPPAILMGEIEMLRAVRTSLGSSDNFCLQLHSVYESPREIILVTALCEGGDMMEYVAQQRHDLRTEDMSRIAHQLLTAIDYCGQQKIIHRDITPENILFHSAAPQSPLRVIDFGAGALDTVAMTARFGSSSDDDGVSHRNDDDDNQQPQQPPTGRHTTFCGTPFYNSPEMFGHNYTQKTDIFSIGVTLYVLAAGYPADQLQKAFNMLQSSANGATRDLKKLPHMPQTMPASFYDMLEGLLVYQPKDRKTARDMLTNPFVTFHDDLLADQQQQQQGTGALISMSQSSSSSHSNSNNNRSSLTLRRQSFSLAGSVDRHNTMLSYKTFERSLTTLLVAMLNDADLVLLVNILRHAVGTERCEDECDRSTTTNNSHDDTGYTVRTAGSFASSSVSNSEASPDAEKLGVIRLSNLVRIVEEDLCHHNVVDMIYDLPDAMNYTQFAYHTSILIDFIKATKKLTMTPQQQRRVSHSLKKSHSMRDFSSGSNGGGSSPRRRSLLRRGSSTSNKKEMMQDSSAGSTRSLSKAGRTEKGRAQSVMIRGF